jgi:hypothetical protein
MMTTYSDPEHESHAWNPGISSSIPPHLKPLITLFQPDNGGVSYQAACEASRLCGLPETELACLSVDRLIIHELLLRVTSDLYVPDGPNYADLGISLRSMVDIIYQRHISAKMDMYRQQFDHIKTQIRTELHHILTRSLMVEKTGVARFFGLLKPKPISVRRDDDSRLAIWKDDAGSLPEA